MKQKPSILKLSLVAVLLVVSVAAWSVLAPSGKVAAATSLTACTPTGTTYGTDSFSASNTPPNPIAIPANGPYHIWARVQVPSVSSSSPLLLNMDNATGNNCYALSGSSITAANTWTWVEATAGLSLPTFTQGNHTLLVTGTQSGASLDLIDILPNIAGCTPTTLSQCSTTANTPPTASLNTPPASGATVSGTVNLTATAAATTSGATITSVQFKDGTTNIGAADTTAPYTTSWNTLGLSGSQTITVVATDSNGLQTTSSGVTVTVNNAATCTTGTLAAPTGLTKGTATYTSIGLSWTAPSPTPGCTISGYNIFRDGSKIATSTAANYTDTGLTAGTSYTYTVQAVDSGPNTSSQSAGASFSTTADNLAPTTPTTLGATVVNASQVDLKWTGSTDLPNPGGSGVKGYNIYRGSSNTPINGTTPVSGTSYSDTTVSPSTSYTYVVTAIDNAGNESSPSNAANASTPAPTCSGNPSQPGTPSAGTRTITSVNFSWSASTASAGCTLNGYHIYQVTGSTYTLVGTAVTSGTNTTISGLNPNTSYTYAVEAFDTSGHTSDKTQSGARITIATLPDTIAPTAPGTVTAIATSSSQVNLTWTAASDNIGVTGYNIYRSDKGSAPIKTVDGATLSYTDTTVSASTSYTYQVSALDANNNESSKTTAAPNPVKTPAATGTAPAAPTNLTVPVITSQSASLGWAASTGSVTGYHVYINGVYDADSTTNSFALTCIAPGVSYTITVKAFNSSGVSSAATVPVNSLSGGLSGDVDCNGTVNATDLFTLLRNWQSTAALPVNGDVNGDGAVNATDLFDLLRNWGKSS